MADERPLFPPQPPPVILPAQTDESKPQVLPPPGELLVPQYNM